MLKFIIPALIVFLTVLFWEKINKTILQKFNVKVNYVVVIILVLVLTIILYVKIHFTRSYIFFNSFVLG